MQVPMLLLIGQQEVLYNPGAATDRARRLIPNFDAGLLLAGRSKSVVHSALLCSLLPGISLRLSPGRLAIPLLKRFGRSWHYGVGGYHQNGWAKSRARRKNAPVNLPKKEEVKSTTIKIVAEHGKKDRLV
jgi:hypothetical protein